MEHELNLNIVEDKPFDWLPNRILFNDAEYIRVKNHGPGRSLNPSPSVQYWCKLRHAWKMWNKKQRQEGHPECNFQHWCINNNIDLSGRTQVDLNRIPTCR